MAETFVNVPTLASGTPIAVYNDNNGKERQVVVIGNDTANIAPVLSASTAPQLTDLALEVVTRPDSVSNDGGTAINGATMPTGGIGLMGWMSACWSQLGSILSKLNGSIAVTGTFWQATQPVSGTFWQATQPVSIAASVSVTGGNKPVGPANVSMVQSSPVTVSATLIIAARTGGVGTGRCSVTMKNTGAALVYIGNGSGVTTSSGFPMSPGDTVTLDTTAAIWGVAASGSNIIAVTETF